MESEIMGYVEYCKTYITAKLMCLVGKNERIEPDALHDILLDYSYRNAYRLSTKSSPLYLEKWMEYFDKLFEHELASYCSPLEKHYNKRFPLACCKNLIEFGIAVIADNGSTLLEYVEDDGTVLLTDSVLTELIKHVEAVEDIIF